MRADLEDRRCGAVALLRCRFAALERGEVADSDRTTLQLHVSETAGIFNLRRGTENVLSCIRS